MPPGPPRVEHVAHTLCESIASVLQRRQLAAADLMDTLPAARRRVFLRRYPEPEMPERGGARRGKSR